MKHRKNQDKSNLKDQAASYAKVAHEGQYRKVSGEPYYTHVESVAGWVAEHEGSNEQIAAAFLHDTLEDTDTDYAQLEREFGSVVAGMVLELTNEDGIPKSEKAKYLSAKMIRMSPDVLLIKLCDILANVSDNPSEDQLKRYEEIVRNVEAYLRSGNALCTWGKHLLLVDKIKETFAEGNNERLSTIL